MQTREKGTKGESIACTFLENRGFTIVARNYLKKWGELDIIARKDSVCHFIEVKSVTSTYHRPEDNVDWRKARRIRRMIQTYFAEQGMSAESEFYVHVICVYMNFATRKARVKWIQNVIL